MSTEIPHWVPELLAFIAGALSAVVINLVIVKPILQSRRGKKGLVEMMGADLAWQDLLSEERRPLRCNTAQEIAQQKVRVRFKWAQIWGCEGRDPFEDLDLVPKVRPHDRYKAG